MCPKQLFDHIVHAMIMQILRTAHSGHARALADLGSALAMSLDPLGINASIISLHTSSASF